MAKLVKKETKLPPKKVSAKKVEEELRQEVQRKLAARGTEQQAGRDAWKKLFGG